MTIFSQLLMAFKALKSYVIGIYTNLLFSRPYFSNSQVIGVVVVRPSV